MRGSTPKSEDPPRYCLPLIQGGGISEKRRKTAKMPYFQDKSQHPRGCLKFAKKIRGCFYTIENQDLHVQVNLTTLMFFGTPYREKKYSRYFHFIQPKFFSYKSESFNLPWGDISSSLLCCFFAAETYRSDKNWFIS